MEKLIKLLNEYLKTKDTEIHRTPKVYAFEEATKLFIAENGTSYRQERVISKRFKFIKWLVDNDKIDFEKIKKWNYINFDASLFSQTNVVITFLAISDTPIEDLVSYLK